MKKTFSPYGLTVLGMTLLGAGLFLVKTLSAPQGVWKPIPYILAGLGCGLFGHGAGDLFSRSVLKKHPEIHRQMEIDTGDERNAAIASRAKAKAYDAMVFIFGTLLLAFTLMNVDLMAVLLLTAAYLFIVGYGIYYRFKYEKEL